jgi:hypothetical protein
MDNLSPHRSAETLSLIQQLGAQVLFLPAYSPDLNPIEKMWSKLKEFLDQSGVCPRVRPLCLDESRVCPRFLRPGVTKAGSVPLEIKQAQARIGTNVGSVPFYLDESKVCPWVCPRFLLNRTVFSLSAAGPFQLGAQAPLQLERQGLRPIQESVSAQPTGRKSTAS